jgi:hypothetical protein
MNMLTNVRFSGGGGEAYSTSVLAVRRSQPIFRNDIRHGVAGCAGRQPTRLELGPLEALWPMMGRPGRRPWIRQKQVEERERVVKNQRVTLGPTDVFFEGCWFGVVGAGWRAKIERRRLVVQILPANRSASHPVTPRFRLRLSCATPPCLPNSTRAAPLPLSSEM